jgi:hypothetical protein
MRYCGPGIGLIVTTLFASGCNGAETGQSGVSSPGGMQDSGKVSDPQQTCNADAVQWAVGLEATPETVERARTESGAKAVRVLPPDLAVTQEFRYGRLNLSVDKQNVITSASCW